MVVAVHGTTVLELPWTLPYMKEGKQKYYPSLACVRKEEDEAENPNLDDVGGNGDGGLAQQRQRGVKGTYSCSELS